MSEMVKSYIIYLPAISNFDTWIINSRDNKHMTCFFKDFLTYFPYTKRENVCVVDRLYTLVSRTCSINSTTIITLSLILHVSNFFNSLLSISTITRDLNYIIKFFSDYCIIQDLQIGKMINTNKLQDDLYILNRN